MTVPQGSELITEQFTRGLRKSRESVIVIWQSCFETGKRENRERTMQRKRTGAQRWMCLLVIFILMFMGMRMEEFHVDSCSGYPDFGRVSLQRGSGEQAAVLYRDTRTLSQLENFTAMRFAHRSLAGMRLGQWMALFLIPAALFLNFCVRERFLPLCAACENQYRRRTLEYIHHMDGKKA